MDITRLNKRYDRLWTKAERLVEAFLNEQLAAIKAQKSWPATIAMREIYITVQCLKRIHEGRHAALTGGNDDLQSLGSSDHAEAVAEEISRRIRGLRERNSPNGNDENSV